MISNLMSGRGCDDFQFSWNDQTFKISAEVNKKEGRLALAKLNFQIQVYQSEILSMHNLISNIGLRQWHVISTVVFACVG